MPPDQGTSNLADLVDKILDKGIVIEAWIRVSVIGIQLLTIEARVVVASVETYLKYAQAIGITVGSSTVPALAGSPVALPHNTAPIPLAAPTVTITAPPLLTAATTMPSTKNADIVANVLQDSALKPKE